MSNTPGPTDFREPFIAPEPEMGGYLGCLGARIEVPVVPSSFVPELVDATDDMLPFLVDVLCLRAKEPVRNGRVLAVERAATVALTSCPGLLTVSSVFGLAILSYPSG